MSATLLYFTFTILSNTGPIVRRVFVEYSSNYIIRDFGALRPVNFLMSFEGAVYIIAYAIMVKGYYEPGLN